MGILAAIRDRWAASPTLTALVPAARVVLGPLNPGTAAPAVGWTSIALDRGLRTTSGRYPTVSVEWQAQTDDPDLLERIAAALEAELGLWTSDTYGTLDLRHWSLRIERPTDSPSRLWRGDGTLTYHTAIL